MVNKKYLGKLPSKAAEAENQKDLWIRKFCVIIIRLQEVQFMVDYSASKRMIILKVLMLNKFQMTKNDTDFYLIGFITLALVRCYFWFGDNKVGVIRANSSPVYVCLPNVAQKKGQGQCIV